MKLLRRCLSKTPPHFFPTLCKAELWTWANHIKKGTNAIHWTLWLSNTERTCTPCICFWDENVTDDNFPSFLFPCAHFCFQFDFRFHSALQIFLVGAHGHRYYVEVTHNKKKKKTLTSAGNLHYLFYSFIDSDNISVEFSYSCEPLA